MPLLVVIVVHLGIVDQHYDAVVLLMQMTVLPKTLTNPSECQFVPSSLPIDAILIMLRVKITCSDMFFSGHGAMITLWMALLSRHTSPSSFGGSRPAFLTFMTLVWALASFGLALIPLTKFHYSIDLYIGVLLPLLFVQLYYDAVRALPWINMSKTPLSWSQTIVTWLESNDPGKPH